MNKILIILFFVLTYNTNTCTAQISQQNEKVLISLADSSFYVSLRADECFLVNTHNQKRTLLPFLSPQNHVVYKMFRHEQKTIWLYCINNIYVLDTLGNVVNDLSLPASNWTYGNEPCFNLKTQMLYFNGADSIRIKGEIVRPFYSKGKFYCWVRQNLRWHIVDSLGRQTAPFFFDNLGFEQNPVLLSNEHWIVKDNNQYALIDPETGKEWWSGEVSHCANTSNCEMTVRNADGSSFLINTGNQTATKFLFPLVIKNYFRLKNPLPVDMMAEFDLINSLPLLIIESAPNTRRYGLVDRTGAIRIEPIYDTIISWRPSYIMAIKGEKRYYFHRNALLEAPELYHKNGSVRIVGDWWVHEAPRVDWNSAPPPTLLQNINTKKEFIVDFAYPRTETDTQFLKVFFYEQQQRVQRIGLLDNKGKWAIKPCDTATFERKEQAFFQPKLRKYGAFFEVENQKGFIVFKNGKFGFVNHRHQLTVPPVYSSLEWLQGDTLLARVGEQSMLISTQNKGIHLFPRQWTLGRIDFTPFLWYHNSTNPQLKGLLNEDLQAVCEPQFTDIEGCFYMGRFQLYGNKTAADKAFFYGIRQQEMLLINEQGQPINKVLLSEQECYSDHSKQALKRAYIMAFYKKSDDFLRSQFNGDWEPFLAKNDQWSQYCLHLPFYDQCTQIADDALRMPFIIFDAPLPQKICLDGMGKAE